MKINQYKNYLLIMFFSLLINNFYAIVGIDRNTTSFVNNKSALVWTHVNSIGNFLIVSITTKDKPVISVKYASKNLVLGKTVNQGNMYVSMYYTIAPDIGINNIEIITSDKTDIYANGTTFINVNQINPVGDFYSNSGMLSVATINISNSINDYIYDVLGTEEKSAIPSIMQLLVGTVGNPAKVSNNTSLKLFPAPTTNMWFLEKTTNWGLIVTSINNNNNIPLFVELISFNITQNNNEINLDWVIATEYNNDYFFIEKSYDNKNWHEIGKIYSIGDHSILYKYIFLDNYDLTNNIIYYRLSQYDYDGKYKILGIQSILIDLPQLVNNILIVPNPVTTYNSATIIFNSDIIQPGNILYYNAAGILIKDEYINTNIGINKYQININTPGTYYIVVSTNTICLKNILIIK